MINFSLFLNATHPKGIIQIIHGMGEHTGRYKNLAHFFNSQGYIIVGQDHPGHGEDAYNNGVLGNINGDFRDIVFRQISVTNWLIDTYPELPIFIFGHSMGSFIAQEHMKRGQTHIRGYILSGSSYKDALWFFGQFLAYFFKGSEKTPLLHNLFFLKANSKISQPKTHYDWLSRDEEVIKRFENDYLTKFYYTGNFYYNFLSFLNQLYSEKSFKNVPRSVSIFIISGEEDPIGKYGKKVKELKKFYEKLNFSDISFKLYPSARHELHNELNRNEVFEVILQWFNRIV